MGPRPMFKFAGHPFPNKNYNTKTYQLRRAKSLAIRVIKYMNETQKSAEWCKKLQATPLYVRILLVNTLIKKQKQNGWSTLQVMSRSKIHLTSFYLWLTQRVMGVFNVDK